MPQEPSQSSSQPSHRCRAVPLSVSWQDAFSLLAYSDPWNCPVGQQLDPMQRESLCSTLNSAILGKRELLGDIFNPLMGTGVARFIPQVLRGWAHPVFPLRVSEPAQAASADAGAGTGHGVCPADGAGPLGLLFLRQSRQLFALAQTGVSERLHVFPAWRVKPS